MERELDGGVGEGDGVLSSGSISITGLPSGEVSVRRRLVLFCVQKSSVFRPHSGEGFPIAERVKIEYAGPLRLNEEVTEKFR